MARGLYWPAVMRASLFCAGLTVFLFGCLAEEPGAPVEAGGDGALAAPAITNNRLLLDGEVEGSAGVGVSDVQALLEFHGSALSDYEEGGQSAAEMIVEAAQASDISAVYLVARIETESGLVRSGTLANIDAATGCKCPDSAGCDPTFAGFGIQVECAAEKMRGYLTSLDTSGATISGWRVGVGKSTLDPCWVVPANRVTAALYTYTPWVGAYTAGCGTSQWGGSSLAALLTRMFAADLAALDPPELETIVVDSNDAENDPAVAHAELSSAWISASSAPGYHGTGYAYASVKPVSDPAVFWFYLEEAGTRTIDAWWTSGSNRSSTAPFLIEDVDGVRLATVLRNQRTDGGRWNKLGTFTFPAGWNRVRLSRWASDGVVVVADAIRVR